MRARLCVLRPSEGLCTRSVSSSALLRCSSHIGAVAYFQVGASRLALVLRVCPRQRRRDGSRMGLARACEARPPGLRRNGSWCQVVDWRSTGERQRYRKVIQSLEGRRRNGFAIGGSRVPRFDLAVKMKVSFRDAIAIVAYRR